MAVTRIVPNLTADDPAAGRDFFTCVLGLELVMERPGFIATYRAPGDDAIQISVLGSDPSGFAPDYSVGSDDVDAALARAVAAGNAIEYGPIDEPWGVRRFFVRDPLGRLANIVGHR